ncbi:hypothetical protein Afil01_22910 [Actinorhabdospora filicis]|uniref:Uncharacterized protein n=1 Tax=Actinorhabdospora filicis TaxID=1785913 RepID=A0A9W6SKR6_9ACTN|nr:hypothetical protein [Actinorhabdospora filicis]GLZ77484.1 hypothetical protein Afil01_22910 [Actinorhabdospora filicis]
METTDEATTGRAVLDPAALERMLAGSWEVRSLRPERATIAAAPPSAGSPDTTVERAVDAAAIESAIAGLGDGLAEAWRERNYDEREFPALAEEALIRAAAHRAWDVKTLTAWLMSSNRVPRQVSAPQFGQPPITLYIGHKFYIEALVWRDGTTAIHQHSFNGAFTVLQGSSLHSQYGFDESDRVCEQLLFGRLTWRSSQILRPGDVHRILPGTAYIHSLFHLEHPSVTLVVRSYTAAGPQYEYFAPGIAADPFHDPQPLKVRLRALEALDAIDPEAFRRTAASLLAEADLWTVWRVLRATAERGAHHPGLLEPARRRHGGPRVDALLAAVTGRVRQLQIARLRQTIRNPEHRFFLALLLNVPDREEILTLIGREHPGIDPADRAVSWLSEIAATGALNLTITPVALATLRMALEKATFADVVATFEQVIPTGEVEERRSLLRQVWDEIHGLPLLSALTAEASARDGRR